MPSAPRYPRLSQPARAVITQRWSRQLLHILAIKVKVIGTPPGVYPAHTLVVANHVSWLDIFALNSVTVSRFVAKKELRDWPVAGYLVKNAGTLFIDRANRRDASRVNQQLAQALQDGGCMAVFPEATTSDGRAMLPFKASLFEAARLAGATVQPVAIRFNHPRRAVLRCSRLRRRHHLLAKPAPDPAYPRHGGGAALHRRHPAGDNGRTNPLCAIGNRPHPHSRRRLGLPEQACHPAGRGYWGFPQCGNTQFCTLPCQCMIDPRDSRCCLQRRHNTREVDMSVSRFTKPCISR